MADSVVGACPECGDPVPYEPGADQWCRGCEWNLGVPDDDRPKGWFERLDRRLAIRISRREFAALDAGRVADSSGRWSLVVAYLLAALVYLVPAALVGFGIWLSSQRFPSFLPMLLGGLLVAVGVFLRPRFGRLDPDRYVLDRSSAPTFFALLDRVCRTVGSPSPDVVVVDDTMNAYCGRVGLRRRSVLGLGVPMWLALHPPARVALLGHEMGHLVNGDLRQAFFVGGAVNTLLRLRYLLRPDPVESGDGIGIIAGKLVAHVVMRVVGFVVLLYTLVLLRLLAGSSQRAEYRADAMAARVGSTGAARQLAEVLVDADRCEFLMQVAARRGEQPGAMVAAADTLRTLPAGERERRRRVSVHAEASLFASHPPSGLRFARLEAAEPCAAAVTVTDTEAARIDAELARHYDRALVNLRHG